MRRFRDERGIIQKLSETRFQRKKSTAEKMMRHKCAPSAPETIPAEREMQDEIRKYCDSVCSRIRWKKARRPVAEELASHICDQRDAYLRAGLKEEEAVCRAVLDMGNPEETGEALDRIHRPAPQWKFLIFAVCALSAGLAARLFSVAFSGGSALLLADSILIGLLLSVFRTEEIKKMLKREEM